ncbi:carboxyl transferase domain-containing protein [Microbacterium sp. B19]|uniref:carboxyl transferase domain-containing protein n=1 Tax=Microbacterium sp. B19 TaxID=96765 RepID=UPI0003494B00|nr:carboxyl transferase domain-containing protein [Microbacterium sp. B19]
MTDQTIRIAEPRVDLPFDGAWRSTDPLGFPGYLPPATSDESIRTGIVHAPLGDYVLIECDFHRMGGTMGVVAGESTAAAFLRAADLRLPVAAIISSGGARLQEGVLALMQMGRTTEAVAVHRRAGLRSAAAFRSPSTGGVFASWGNAVDMRAVAPGAVIGFGGPRVVEVVTGERPDATSHNAEAAYHDGNVDALVPEEQQQEWLECAIGVRHAPEPLRLARPAAPRPSATPWEAVLAVRTPEHPSGMDWVSWLADEWMELRGAGRCFRAGIARIGGIETAVVAMQRDKTGRRNAGPVPADFRLAQRTIRLADRVGLPVLTVIDTPGADPSPASETEGLAREISHTLVALSDLSTPSVGLCVGEGGSGGAMGLAWTDTLLLSEGSVFSVIGPEPGAAVLYRDAARAPELATAFRLRAEDVVATGFGDAIVPNDVDATRAAVVDALRLENAGRRVVRADAASRAAMRIG